MTNRELRRLSRLELVQLLLEQTREVERLRAELAQAQADLEDRRILIRSAGSIAAASVEIAGVLQAAQRAADLYLENVKRLAREEAAHAPQE